jgi:hypothetical protein
MHNHLAEEWASYESMIPMLRRLAFDKERQFISSRRISVVD